MSDTTTTTAPEATETPDKSPQSSRTNWIYWGISIIVPVVVYLAIPSGGALSEEARRFIALTLWALIAWALSIMPIYVAGVALTLLYVLTSTATPDVVFSPWTGMVVWLTLGGLTLAAIFEKTGLLSRIAYWFIIRTGGSYRGIVIGLALSGIPVGLLVPNMTGRVALYAALTFGIIRALKVKANTKAAAGIMFGGFTAATASAWFYLSASENLQLINSYLNEHDLAVSWIDYFLATFLPALIFMAAMVAVTLFLFKGKFDTEHGKAYFQAKADEMGKLAPREIKFLAILIVLVVAMVFSSIAPGWLFMSAVVACFLPGIDVATAEDLKEVNYMMVFFVAATMSIGSVAGAVNIPEVVTEAILPMLSGTNNYTFVLLVFVFGVIADFLMTPLAGMATFVPSLIELSLSLGLSPNGAAFGFVWGVEQLIFPYEWALFLILFSFGMFDMKKAILWSAARMVLAFVVLAAVLLPFWMLTGFVS